jgi:uncharacterized DUF497 family protein
VAILGRFEWDDAKGAASVSKHGMAFELALPVFEDGNSIDMPAANGNDQARWRRVGMLFGKAVV